MHGTARLSTVVGFGGRSPYGADAGNAFAESPPPVAPFFIEVDDAYREWWTDHLGKLPIPEDYVLPVKHALQGHPESPWLWEKHITHHTDTPWARLYSDNPRTTRARVRLSLNFMYLKCLNHHLILI